MVPYQRTELQQHKINYGQPKRYIHSVFWKQHCVLLSNYYFTSSGCCTWYDERQYLADIEEHLGVTIQQMGKDMNIQVDEFDGKVVYGEKRKETGTKFFYTSITRKIMYFWTGINFFLTKHFVSKIVHIIDAISWRIYIIK